VWDDLVLVYFEGEVWKQEIEHLGFKAQYSNMYLIDRIQLLISSQANKPTANNICICFWK
jgi:hypothetical protein